MWCVVSAHLVTLTEEKSTELIQHVLGVPEKGRTHIENSGAGPVKVCL